MNGSFTGGSFVEPAPAPTPAPKAAAPKAAAPVSAKVGARLDLTVGPGFTIGLKTRAGKPVTNLAAGAYTIVVRDRAATHNAHLRGTGIDRTTGIPYVGTTTFAVTLKKGTLRFVCDPHRTTMKGAVAVS